ncbi:ABC transporter ATP-binding protein [Ahniella affigens]|uniref:ABC transporter ATP-binding protein n=1 Tax=Ahniella affigens TaxID=2021234 RepID=A0A2P1PNH3_9GAMM|nr:ABC transporter ATP-binding protein [Ahniella affigens]AVP96403.1 ABC transporter ATP-binding protein [Ahniella affigens]
MDTPHQESLLIDARDLGRRYPSAAGDVVALTGVSFRISRGEFVAVVGASGSGKSTLLHLLGGLDRPSSGELWVAGTNLAALSEQALTQWRARQIGFVFQFFQLLPTLTVLENVMLPMALLGEWPRSSHRSRALALLDQLGVSHTADRLPGTLSGGQQQRVAVARALANEPPLILADEPTGNLDSRNATTLLELLASLAAAGRSVILVTHERHHVPGVQRVLALSDGRLLPSDAT